MSNSMPILAGKPISFDAIYDRYKEATMRRALRLLNGNYHDAEDAMQDAWGYIAAHADRLQFENEAMLSSYVMLTVEGRARALLDKKRRRGTVPLPEDEEETDGTDIHDPVLYQLCAEETVETIRRAIEEMKPIYREVLILALLYDMPTSEVAKTLGIRQSTANMRLKRGKQALANALRKENSHE